MASFRTIKERINSVKSTRKITSAMKMVSSAKLVRAQRTIGNMLPYSEAMGRILGGLVASGEGIVSPFYERREVKRVAVVAFSSDTSLAGSFNSNVARRAKTVMERNFAAAGRENVTLYTVGKKVFEQLGRDGCAVTENFTDLAAKPDYERIAALADRLAAQFLAGEVDRVELVYHHFKSAGAQELVCEDFLPIPAKEIAAAGNAAFPADYILEPSREQILEDLLPRFLRLKLYTVLLDSAASEHAARVIAMQTATDNAGDLISELTIEYNKSRQQAITAELLDMLGGQGE